MKQHKKLAKYIRGTGKALIQLAKEIEEEGKFSKDSKDLLSKVGSNLVFEANVFTFRK